jgi:hypothetical protein
VFKLIVSVREQPLCELTVRNNEFIEIEAIYHSLEWERLYKRLELLGRIYESGDEASLACQLGLVLDDGLRINRVDEAGEKSPATVPDVGILLVLNSKLRLVPWQPKSLKAILASLGVEENGADPRFLPKEIPPEHFSLEHSEEVYKKLIDGFLYSEVNPNVASAIDFGRVMFLLSKASCDLVYANRNLVRSSASVARILSNAGVIESETNFLINKIAADWLKLRPANRVYFKNLATASTIAEIARLPDLADHELRLASVKWQAADALFFSEKENSLQGLATKGFNLLSSDVGHVAVLDIEKKYIPVFVDLIRIRAQIDISLVALFYQELRTSLLLM